MLMREIRIMPMKEAIADSNPLEDNNSNTILH